MTQGTYVPDVSHTKAQALSFFDTVLEAIATTNAGATAPAETYPYMLWFDTSVGRLKIRNAANSGWLEVRDVLGLGGLATQNIVNSTSGTSTTAPMSQAAAKTYTDAAVGGITQYTDAQARNAQAGHGAGGVGSYALLKFNSFTLASENSNHAGSGLRYTSASADVTGGTPAGTWKLLGRTGNSNNSQSTSVFLRIS